MRFGISMLGVTTILFGAFGIALKDAHPQSAADSRVTPLILEKNEGEHRVRRPRETPVPTGPFTIKIDRKNGGSQKMFVGTEEIPAGGVIPRHKFEQRSNTLTQTLTCFGNEQGISVAD